MQWQRLYREMAESPSLKMFKNHGDVMLMDMVSAHGRDELTVGLDDLKGLPTLMIPRRTLSNKTILCLSSCMQ